MGLAKLLIRAIVEDDGVEVSRDEVDILVDPVVGARGVRQVIDMTDSDATYSQPGAAFAILRWLSGSGFVSFGELQIGVMSADRPAVLFPLVDSEFHIYVDSHEGGDSLVAEVLWF